MNNTIKEILNKYELEEHSVEDQLMALVLISLGNNGLFRQFGDMSEVRQYLKQLKGKRAKSCEVQYAAA